MYKIAIFIIASITISGAVATLGPTRNHKLALMNTLDPTAMMREAKNLPVDPAYSAF